MKLTSDNYFSREAQMEYMGASQFKAFRKCEAAALAELDGRYTRPVSTAILVGSYVDAYFEGSLDQFKQTHPEIFKRDGSMKSDYVQADRIIKRLEQDELFMLLMSGRKQVIFTGEISGVPYKIKVDSLLDSNTCSEIVQRFPDTASVFGFCDGAIVDLKIMKDMQDQWSAEDACEVPFAKVWGYDIQGAIYQAVQGDMLPFILAVGTKEPATDLGALYIPDSELAACLNEVEEYSPRYAAIKRHEIDPVGCGHCEWCRSQKKLTKIIDYRGADFND